MANEYTNFKRELSNFTELETSAHYVNDGPISPQDKRRFQETASNLFNTSETQVERAYCLSDNVSRDELFNVLTEGTRQSDVELTNQGRNLAAIINDPNMPIEEVTFGALAVPARENYEGPNAEVYTRIRDTGRRVTEMSEILQNRDVPNMVSDVSEYETQRLTQANVNTNQIDLANALINAGGNFNLSMYPTLVHEKQGEYGQMINDNGRGYLIANLGDTNFKDFYFQLTERMQEARNPQRNGRDNPRNNPRNGNGNQGQGRPRQRR